MNLKIISGTDRPNSNALKVSEYVKSLYEAEGVEAEIIDMQDFPLADVAGGKYGTEIPSVTNFRKPVVEADGVIFVIPEYNGSFPGVLKVFVDYLPFPEAFTKLPMAFIGEASGGFGGLRAVEQFQMIANYRNALQFPERVFIPRVEKEFDLQKGLDDPFKQNLLESQVRNFIKYVEAVQGDESLKEILS
ncbi:MAG: NAD(P)H-dependent oxidoreductase [Balneolaceae bacterium]|nr:NAD(P)H-dependent oxidoreductase [Balneolaceae bacterium]